MNTEEKAKAYDIILQRITELYETGTTLTREQMVHLFPELRESEDERIRKDIEALIKFGLEDGSAVSPGSSTTKEEALAYLKKQKEQKPAEWSEEDKQWLSEVYFAIDHSMYSEDERKAMKKYIDYLRSQSKPAEWSEEDEEIFNNIIEKAKGGHWIEVNEITWLINRFKSLRPSWKPSEEQMNYLRAAVIEAKRKHNESVNGYPRYAGLKSLYEDLEKQCNQ